MRNRCPLSLLVLFPLVTLLVAPLPTFGQESPETEYVPEKDGSPASANRAEEGWDGALSLGANLSMTSNQGVVGQTDGFSALFGLSTNGALEFVSGDHELHNTLTLTENFAQTPQLDRFVKNQDSLVAQSLYNYFFLPWTGFFGRADVETTVFETNNVTPEPASYVVTRNDGSQETFDDFDQLKVADAFSPTSLGQSAGVFVKPVRLDQFQLTSRFGLGARETLADGVLIIEDDPGTDPIEATELSSVFQGGFEVFLGFEGTFETQRISYSAGATGLLPIVNNDPENRDPFELFRTGVVGSVNFNAFEWLSINYNLKVLRDVQLVDETQVQNNLMLTLNYSLIERSKTKKTKTTEEKLQEATERAEKAEERVQKLEQKVETLEQGDGEGSDDGSSDDAK